MGTTDKRGLSAPANSRRRGAASWALAALAIAALPTGASAGGFWQLDAGGALAPGVAVERVGFSSRRNLMAERTAPTTLFVDLPSIASRFGLLFSRDGDRPSLDGLAFEMTRTMRLSAKGGYDMDNGEISGEVHLHFDF